MTALWVALAGGGGALARYALDGLIRCLVGDRLPYGTATINVTGSLLLGVLTGAVLFHAAPADLRVIAGTGFCGGYTTFSTASLETVRLVEQRRLRAAVGYSIGSAVAGLLAAAAGLALASL